MKRSTIYSWSVFVLLIVVSGQAVAAERDTPNGTASFPFNFSPPGARALGMGGAFIGIADDATASEANPAGLTILTRPEFSIHFRESSFEIENDDLNAEFSLGLINLFGSPFTATDTVGTFDETVQSTSFVSFVKPMNNWVISFYHQEAGRLSGSTSFSATDEFFIDFYSATRELNFLFENTGVSVAMKKGKFSFGASMRFSEISVRLVEELRIDYFADFEFLSGNLDHIDFFLFRDTIDDTHMDLTYNLGFLYNQNGKFSFGAVYKNNGEYSINSTSEFIDCIDFPPFFLTCDPETLVGNSAFRDASISQSSFELPDFAGIGFAWRPSERLTLALDVNYITYSNLPPFMLGPDPFPEEANAIEAVDDEFEFHFGLEHIFLFGSNKIPLTLRAGIYTEEDHDGYTKVDSAQTHYTVGFGIVIKKDLQVDIAGHYADNVEETLLSLVYRF